MKRALILSSMVCALLGGACALRDDAGDEKARARCFALAGVYDRYTTNKPFGTGPHLGRDIAEEQCRRGFTDEGLRALEDLLRRHELSGVAARY